MEKAILVVNPVAGRGKAQRLLPHLLGLLGELGVPFEHRLTSRPGEATELARLAVEEGFRCVVAVGGDGTTQEVVNGIIGSSAALGVIPTGSGNDFAKAVGVPLKLSEAVATLKRGRVRRIDLAKLGDRYFVNGLGIGLDGAVAHRFRKMKRLGGELGYLWGAIHECIAFRSFPVELKAPDWQSKGRALLTGVCNGRYLGGNFQLTPHARVDDGLLDIYIFGDMPPIRRLIEIPKVRRGTHLSLKEIEIHRAPWVEISSAEPLPAHMDGEIFVLPSGRVRVEVVPKALDVIAQPSEV